MIMNSYEENATPINDEKVEKDENSDIQDFCTKDKKNSKKCSKELEAVKAELENVKSQFDEINDKYFRVMAEYDNYRRRTIKEKESLYSDSVCDVIKAMLPVLDNLERASHYDGNADNAEGITMILKNMQSILEGFGVKEIEALGCTFDPNLHNAIMHTDDEQYGENEIYNVLQKGYIMGDKVIRHAYVMVAN